MFSSLFCWLWGSSGREAEELRAKLSRARDDLVRVARERDHARDEVARLQKLFADTKEILAEIESCLG